MFWYDLYQNQHFLAVSAVPDSLLIKKNVTSMCITLFLITNSEYLVNIHMNISQKAEIFYENEK